MPQRGEHFFCSAISPWPPTEGATYGARDGMWVFRAESGVCGVLPAGIALSIEEKPVSSLSMLIDGQALTFGGETGRFQEIYTLKITEGSRLLSRKCAFCNQEHAEGSIVIRCPWCGEGYCPACWGELIGERCLTRNCSYSPRKPHYSKSIEISP